MEAIPYTERTCIIVVEIEVDSGIILTGIVVDSVSEVLNIRDTEIEDTPSFGINMSTEYILGVAKMEDCVKILLSINKVLNNEDIITLEATTEN